MTASNFLLKLFSICVKPQNNLSIYSTTQASTRLVPSLKLQTIAIIYVCKTIKNIGKHTVRFYNFGAILDRAHMCKLGTRKGQ